MFPLLCINEFFNSGQHYYWDWSSDLVSWLPPGHPKCQISQPASQLREELHLKAADQDDNMSSDDSGSDQEPMEVSHRCFFYGYLFLI